MRGITEVLVMADPLDWSKLPSELSWLAGSAERFGLLQLDDPIHDILART